MLWFIVSIEWKDLVQKIGGENLKDGITRTVGSFSKVSNNLGFSRKQRSCGSSKANKVLGSRIGDTIC
ncbi:unnamed protein product [Urochloa humidicola]